MTIRDHETYRQANLSVQASKYSYCTPKTDDLPLADYSTVEVAIIGKDGLIHPTHTLGRIRRHLPFLPRTRQARSLNLLFEDGKSPVAGYVSQADVDRIRDFLR